MVTMLASVGSRVVARENGDPIRIRMPVRVFADHVVQAVLTF